MRQFCRAELPQDFACAMRFRLETAPVTTPESPALVIQLLSCHTLICIVTTTQPTDEGQGRAHLIADTIAKREPPRLILTVGDLRRMKLTLLLRYSSNNFIS